MYFCLTYASSKDTTAQDGDRSTVVVFWDFPGGAHGRRWFNVSLESRMRMLLNVTLQSCSSIVMAGSFYLQSALQRQVGYRVLAITSSRLAGDIDMRDM